MAYHDLRHFVLVLLLSGAFWWLVRKAWEAAQPDLEQGKPPSGMVGFYLTIAAVGVLFYQAVVDFPN